MDPHNNSTIMQICRSIAANPGYRDTEARIHTAGCIPGMVFLSGNTKKKLISVLLDNSLIFTSTEVEYLNHLLPQRMIELSKDRKSFGHK